MRSCRSQFRSWRRGVSDHAAQSLGQPRYYRHQFRRQRRRRLRHCRAVAEGANCFGVCGCGGAWRSTVRLCAVFAQWGGRHATHSRRHRRFGHAGKRHRLHSLHRASLEPARGDALADRKRQWRTAFAGSAASDRARCFREPAFQPPAGSGGIADGGRYCRCPRCSRRCDPHPRHNRCRGHDRHRDRHHRTDRIRGVSVGANCGAHRRRQRLAAAARSPHRRASGAGGGLRRTVSVTQPLPGWRHHRCAGCTLSDFPDYPRQPDRRLALTNHALTVTNLSAGYGENLILEDLDLVVPEGKITVIVGANACGKSTLLRTMSRLLSPRRGHVLLDGKSIHSMPPKKLARTLGLLPQSPIAPEGITVADLVSRGRHPYQGILSRWSSADNDAVATALEATKTFELAERPVDELSGGQRQRVWIAMALAQQTDILLLDEPTTFLDISHQIEVLDLLVDLNHSRGTTIVMVLHDLNLAARYADHLVAMAKGRLHITGSPQDVLTQDHIREVFGLESRVIIDPTSGRPMMLPIGRHRMTDASLEELY
ncbi:ABC transporter ATP-binding protein [Agrobacterium vaccinii]|nr:ABC transporter ATP-binding protein [Agrobacterium vaccinii]